MKCLVTRLGEIINNPNLENFETNKYIELIANKFQNGVSGNNYTALSTFVKELSNSGIIGKIQYMALPMFAANAGEAIQNVMLTSKTIPSIPSVGLNSGCITFNSDGNVDLTPQLKEGINNKMFFVSAIKNYSMSEGSQLLAKFAENNSNSSVVIGESGGAAKENAIFGSQVTYSLAPIDNYHTIALSADGAGTLNFYGLSDSEYIAQTKSITVPSAMDRFVMNGANETWFGKCNANIRVIIVGNTLLTTAEVKALHDAVDTFVKNW